jgi:translation elongation factor EF-1beta
MFTDAQNVDSKGHKMSSVIVIFRIYPKEGMLDSAISEIKTTMKPQDMRTEEVAFGIKLIRVAFKFDDSQMGSSKLEDQLKTLKSVGEVEVEEETLL